MNFERDVARLDWEYIERQLDAEGYSVLPRFLSRRVADELRHLAKAQPTQAMVADGPGSLGGPGSGQLSYPPRDLPPVLREMSESFYRRLAPVANRWSKDLGTETSFPAELPGFLHSPSNFSFLREGDYQALHRRHGDAQVFPLQLAVLLSHPGTEYFGGELMLVEQRPRMQSRPMVIAMEFADVAIMATSQRPKMGAKGHHYRTNLKHAVSRVHKGERIGLEIFFHDCADLR